MDVVLELTSAFDHDASALSQYEQGMLDSSFQPATYNWDDFRRETLKALESGFGSGMVAQGNKSIRLKADPPRLAADVVVCMKYRRYSSGLSTSLSRLGRTSPSAGRYWTTRTRLPRTPRT